MHCSLYCCIHSLCKPQNPTHLTGFLHGKIYIVMLLPKITCCKPFHSFLHIENITHSSKKKIIASLICKNLRNGMSGQYTVNLYAKYQCIDTVVAYTAITATALKTENHVPLTKLAPNAVSMEKKPQNIAMQLCISSKEPVQPKYQVKVWAGSVQNVPELKNGSALLGSAGSKAILLKCSF